MTPEDQQDDQRRFPPRRILRLLAIAIGVLVAIPLVLGIIYRFDPVRPVSTLMLARHMLFQSVDRQWMDLEQIAPVMVHSVIMSEDGKFCSHGGVDWEELNAQIDDALEGEKVRGASTLTMQTSKNLFLWTSRSYLRKAAEIPLAIYLDLIWPKHRIMEVYLNIAEWDEGVFGIEAAAQHYFGRSASRLTARQAALLTITLPNPQGRNAAKPTRGMNRIADIVQRRARQAGAYVKCVRQG